MPNKLQSDQRLIDVLLEKQRLKEQPNTFAQRVFEVVEDTENLSDSARKHILSDNEELGRAYGR